MKKLLILLALTAFTACGNASEPTEVSETEQTETQEIQETESIAATLSDNPTPTAVTTEVSQEEDNFQRAVDYLVENAPAILGEIVGEEVQLAHADSFIRLPSRRHEGQIFVTADWTPTNANRSWLNEAEFTIEAIFSFSLSTEWAMSVTLQTYNPFGLYDHDWRTRPLNWDWVPGAGIRQQTDHVLDTVPVRIYEPDPDMNWRNFPYETVYLDGTNFAQELGASLGSRIESVWFDGRVMFVNLHLLEPFEMSMGGSMGDILRQHTFEMSLASVPEIDAFVVLVDNVLGHWVGGHGGTFRDVYLVADFWE